MKRSQSDTFAPGHGVIPFIRAKFNNKLYEKATTWTLGLPTS